MLGNVLLKPQVLLTGAASLACMLCKCGDLKAVLVLQARAQAPKLRDWERLVETCITKAAMAHAAPKLLAMHSTVPNLSSRMVFQSCNPSIQPGMDLSAVSPAGSSQDNSSEAGTVQADGPQQLPDKAAALLANDRTPWSATLAEGVPDQLLLVQRPEQPSGHIQTAVKCNAQPSRQQLPDAETLAGVSKQAHDLRGIMSLAPLVKPNPVGRIQHRSSPASLGTSGSSAAGPTAHKAWAGPGAVLNPAPAHASTLDPQHQLSAAAGSEEATDATAAGLLGGQQEQSLTHGIAARKQAAMLLIRPGWQHNSSTSTVVALAVGLVMLSLLCNKIQSKRSAQQ